MPLRMCTIPRRMCAVCSAEFACPASFRGKAPKCSGCRRGKQRQQAPAEACHPPPLAVIAPATAATAWLTEAPIVSDSAGGGSLASWSWAPETMPHAMQQQPAMHQPMMGNQGFSQPAFGQPVLGFGQGGALGHGDSFGNQYTPAFCPIGNQYTPAFCPAGLLPCELIKRYCALMQQSQRFFGGPGMMPPPSVDFNGNNGMMPSFGAFGPYSQMYGGATGSNASHINCPPQNGSAGSAPRHMTPCACHCAACRAAGHGNTCILLRMGLLRLFDGKSDIVDLVLRHYHGASGWDKARFDAVIHCVQYGPAGDVIATGDADGFIHLICAQTGEKILSLKGHR
jgi:hypothetical protein